MSEEEITTTETPLDDFASLLDDWIQGAGLTQIPVTIYGKGHLHVEFLRLEDERELLEAELSALEDQNVETVLSERSRAAEIRVRLDEIEEQYLKFYDEWQASKSVWIVEDISEQIATIRESVGPLPEAPVKPVKTRASGDKRQRDHAERAHTIAMQEYEKALADYEKLAESWNEKFALVSAAAAVVRVEFADGRVADGATAEQIAALAKAAGQKQVNRLQAAMREAMTGEPVVDAPLSHTTLPDDQI